MEKRKLEKTA